MCVLISDFLEVTFDLIDADGLIFLLVVITPLFFREINFIEFFALLGFRNPAVSAERENLIILVLIIAQVQISPAIIKGKCSQ